MQSNALDKSIRNVPELLDVSKADFLFFHKIHQNILCTIAWHECWKDILKDPGVQLWQLVVHDLLKYFRQWCWDTNRSIVFLPLPLWTCKNLHITKISYLSYQYMQILCNIYTNYCRDPTRRLGLVLLFRNKNINKYIHKLICI